MHRELDAVSHENGNATQSSRKDTTSLVAVLDDAVKKGSTQVLQAGHGAPEAIRRCADTCSVMTHDIDDDAMCD